MYILKYSLDYTECGHPNITILCDGWTSHFKPWANNVLLTPSSFLGWFSTGFWNLAAGSSYLDTRALVRSGLCAPNQISLQASVCALGNCHTERGKDLPQIVATKLKSHSCLKYQKPFSRHAGQIIFNCFSFRFLFCACWFTVTLW